MKNWSISNKCNDLVPYRGSGFLWPRGETLFESFLNEVLKGTDIRRNDVVPALDIHEKDGKIMVESELPGMEKKDINVRVEDGILTISGEKKTEAKDEKDGYYRVERSFGKFERSVRLPSYAKDDTINASYKDGVLKIEIPCEKDKDKGGRDIAIK